MWCPGGGFGRARCVPLPGVADLLVHLAHSGPHQLATLCLGLVVPSPDAGGLARIELLVIVHAPMLARRGDGVKGWPDRAFAAALWHPCCMSDARRAARESAPALLLAALTMVSLALRPQLAAIGPLSGRIIDDIGVSHAFVGLLTTIPILCMGVFAPLGPALAGRIGSRWAIAVGAGVVGLAGVGRAASPGEAALLAWTLLIGVATATTGPALAMFE